MPDRRQLCGLWWADFDIASDADAAATDDEGDGVDGAAAPAPPPSAFRATLLHHVEACTYHMPCPCPCAQCAFDLSMPCTCPPPTCARTLGAHTPHACTCTCTCTHTCRRTCTRYMHTRTPAAHAHGTHSRTPRAGAARLQAAPRRRLRRQPLGGRGAVAAAARGGRARGHLDCRRGGDHAHRARAGHVHAAARGGGGAARGRRAARVLARGAAPPGGAARPRRHRALRVRMVGGRRRRAALRRVVCGGGAQRRAARLPLARPRMLQAPSWRCCRSPLATRPLGTPRTLGALGRSAQCVEAVAR